MDDLRTSFLLALLTAACLGGCSSSHERFPDGGGGEACGPTTCDPGLVCCNASCGICVEPGSSCPAIACVPDAGLVDAGGTACGDTTCAPGERCCPGCTPEEAVCVSEGELCPSGPPCELDAGLPRACGARLGDTCAADEFCDFESFGCDWADATGTCRPRPEECTTELFPVCGCDGVTYPNPCAAQMAGTDVASEGPCPGDRDCGPMDVRGSGPCAAFFGYAWDGDECVGLSGCDCEGPDCGALYDTYDACLDDHLECIDDCRATGCPDGQRCERCWSDYACLPDGAVC
jgi:hypothetical protein